MKSKSIKTKQQCNNSKVCLEIVVAQKIIKIEKLICVAAY